MCFVEGIAFTARNRKHNPDDADPVTILENASDDPVRICKVFEHVIHGKRPIVTRLHHGKGIVVLFRKIKFDCPSLRFIELHSDRVNLKPTEPHGSISSRSPTPQPKSIVLP